MISLILDSYLNTFHHFCLKSVVGPFQNLHGSTGTPVADGKALIVALGNMLKRTKRLDQFHVIAD